MITEAAKRTTTGARKVVYRDDAVALTRPAPGEQDRIRLALIDPSPFQRRKDFNNDELLGLARSIRRLGVIEPVLVRAKPDGRYELVAGERRVRASRLAELQEIPAIVVTYSDAEAAEACDAENSERAPLNPIEQAETIRMLLDTTGLTQKEVGERLKGKTQSWVANQLRLLELPEAWQAKVISQEIPPTHARELLRYAGRPTVLAKVDEFLAPYRRSGAEFPSVVNFATLVKRAAVDVSKPCQRTEVAFALTDEVRAELDVVEVDLPYGGSMPRAFNVAAWERLQKAALAEQRKADARPSEPAAAATKSPAKSAAKTAKRTTAKAPKLPPQPPSGRGVHDRVRPWLAGEIAKRVKKTDRDLCQRLCLMLDLCIAGPDAFFQFREDTIAELLGVAKPPGGRFPRPEDRVQQWKALAAMTPARVGKLAYDCVQAAFADPHLDFEVEVLVAVLAHVGGDPLAYRMTAGDVELYAEELLLHMLDLAVADLPAKAKKQDLVDAVLKKTAGGWLPKEFREALTPIAAAKKPAKKAKPR